MEEKFDIVTHLIDLVYKFWITNFHSIEKCSKWEIFNIKNTWYTISIETFTDWTLYNLRVYRDSKIILEYQWDQEDDCKRLYSSLLNYCKDDSSMQRQEEIKSRDMEIKAIITEDRAKYLNKSGWVMDEVFEDYNELQKAYNTVINITNKYSKNQFKLFNN